MEDPNLSECSENSFRSHEASERKKKNCTIRQEGLRDFFSFGEMIRDLHASSFDKTRSGNALLETGTTWLQRGSIMGYIWTV